LERIFNPFVQAEQSTVRRFGGTGLGLTVRSQHLLMSCDVPFSDMHSSPLLAQICRKIARAMGGDLTAASEGMGKGTTMTFTIPLCEPPGDVAVSSGAAVNAADAPLDGAWALALPESAASRGISDDSALKQESEDAVAVTGGSADGVPAFAAPLAALRPPPLLPPPSPTASPAPPVTPPSVLPSPNAAHILVAEDDPLSQAVMRKVLSRLGLRHTLVGDGAAAVEAYRRGAQLLLCACIAPPLTRSHCSRLQTPTT
jgi:two-component system sensor histidine kinase EvgS